MKKEALAELETLFDFVSPQQLKSSITNLLLVNLIHTADSKPHKKEVYQDIYFLFDFFDNIDKLK